MKSGQHFKIYLVILLIIIPVFVSGCWDSHELNKLSIAVGLGWDMDPGKGKVTITYQSIVPSQVKSPSSSGGGGEQKGGGGLQTVHLDHSTGTYQYDALNRYTAHGSRMLFYQHAQVYVFGKDAAKQGIYPFLDTIARNVQGRPDVLMVVSESTASDILGIQDGMENIPAIGMAAEIKLSANYSKYPAVSFLDFANRMMSKTTAPIAPVIGIFDETGSEGNKEKRFRITGTAVFKGDKMIGKLNERESSGLLWAINQIKTGFVNIPEASMQIVQAKSRIVPELTDGKIEVTIEIKEESNLIEYKGHQDLTPDILQQLEKRQAEEIKSLVMAAVQKSFSLDADVFGFGDAVHHKYKKEWKDLKSQWDNVYPGIEVLVKVKTHLNEIGDINKSILKD